MAKLCVAPHFFVGRHIVLPFAPDPFLFRVSNTSARASCSATGWTVTTLAVSRLSHAANQRRSVPPPEAHAV